MVYFQRTFFTRRRWQHLRLHASRTSYYATVDKVAEAITRYLVELDGQKSRIQEQLFSMTPEDVRRALWDSSNSKVAILSIVES